MNINIEKIANGYVITIDGTRTFCDVPEAICGITSEWVLKECERLEKGEDVADFKYAQRAGLAHAAAQNQLAQAQKMGAAVSPTPAPSGLLGQLTAKF